MSKIKEEDIEDIRKAVEKEFPEDLALQQVRIARKIIAKEAQLEGLRFFEYVKLLGGSELRMSNEGTAYNRAYLASAITFAKIHLRGTSDTPGTLSEMPQARKIKNREE